MVVCKIAHNNDLFRKLISHKVDELQFKKCRRCTIRARRVMQTFILHSQSLNTLLSIISSECTMFHFKCYCVSLLPLVLFILCYIVTFHYISHKRLCGIADSSIIIVHYMNIELIGVILMHIGYLYKDSATGQSDNIWIYMRTSVMLNHMGSKLITHFPVLPKF